MFSDFQLRIVLVSPRIAANVGAIARTCEALGAELHLVGPFGFFLKEKSLRRSSVGSWESLEPQIYRDAEDFWGRFEGLSSSEFYWATKQAEEIYTDCEFGKDATILFGNEEEGVDPAFFQARNKVLKAKDFGVLPRIRACRIPMRQVRCLNLATSVGIMGYEVFRQLKQRDEQQGLTHENEIPPNGRLQVLR